MPLKTKGVDDFSIDYISASPKLIPSDVDPESVVRHQDHCRGQRIPERINVSFKIGAKRLIVSQAVDKGAYRQSLLS